jgi:hypothetical protein
MADRTRVVVDRTAVLSVLRGPTGPVVADLLRRGNRVRNQAVRNVPVDTGQLRSSITVELVQEGSVPMVRVGTNLPHGRYVEEGTGIYGPKGRPIRPTSASVLRWQVRNNTGRGRRNTGRYAYARSVKGMRPRPWLRPALDAARGIQK